MVKISGLNVNYAHVFGPRNGKPYLSVAFQSAALFGAAGTVCTGSSSLLSTSGSETFSRSSEAATFSGLQFFRVFAQPLRHKFVVGFV